MNSKHSLNVSPINIVAFMEVTAPCGMCRTHTQCICKSSLIAYLGLLERAQRRVLSRKDASATLPFAILGAGVDKLCARLTQPLATSEVQRRAAELGLEVRQTYLDRKHCLRIGSEENFVQLLLNFEKSHITQIISNPNRFKRWKTYLLFLESIIPIQVLNSAVISRVDLNIDFACSFSELIQFINIKNKSLSMKFQDKGGERTGLSVGKGLETIEIYDKTIESNLLEPRSRLEVRLKGNKIPCQLIYDAPNALQKGSYFDALEGLTVIYPPSLPSDLQIQKLQDFKFLLEREGIYSARKALNQNRNFDRDFSGLIKIEKWEMEISGLFKKEIGPFFDPLKNHLRLI